MVDDRHTADASAILRRRYVAGDPAREASVEDERACADIAQMIYDMRERFGITQAELARRVGTTQSVISRMESADYGGHSLSMLRRIARALGCKLEVAMRPLPAEHGSR